MSGFSKKLKTESNSSSTTGGGNSTSTITNDDWNTWNETLWNAFTATITKQANGKEQKEANVIGVLNYIQELGSQPQEDIAMDSNLKVPEEGEKNSQEELDRIAKYPQNYFEWQDDYKDGKKTAKRKVRWPLHPEEGLVLAVDFPTIKVDYNLHPANPDEGENITPLRVDYNGKWKQSFKKTVNNQLHWKTGKLNDKSIQYKIATACGFLEEYQNDGHDLSYLVQATCNWTLKMTKNVTDKGSFYNIEIKDPSPIQEIQGRTPYTVSEQLEDNICEVPFCGILFDDEGAEYPLENLKQIREFWLSKTMLSTAFDKNAGTTREGEWMAGTNWEDSTLYKACIENDIKLPTPYGSPQNNGNQQAPQKATVTPSQESKPLAKQTPVQEDKVAKTGGTETPVVSNHGYPAEDENDFMDEIPF